VLRVLLARVAQPRGVEYCTPSTTAFNALMPGPSDAVSGCPSITPIDQATLRLVAK